MLMVLLYAIFYNILYVFTSSKIVAAVSLQTSPQLVAAVADGSPDPQRTDSRATATRSPRGSTLTPVEGPAEGSRPPSSSSVGGKLSAGSRRASSGRQSTGAGGVTSPRDDDKA